MKSVKKIPLWFTSGLLYGLSWPLFNNINLSFLAWFAFVPLFIFLEKNKNNFWNSMLGCLAAMLIFSICTAIWIFNFPISNFQVSLIFFSGVFWFFIPFIPFYYLQKKIGFDKALWIFPVLWMIWEWVYLSLEFTMGTHLSAYSQSSNLWLIQYVDITGMWGVSFWLLLLNVLLFKTYKNYQNNLNRIKFFKKLSIIFAFMVGLPILYAFYSYSLIPKNGNKTIDITLIPTNFASRYLLETKNRYTVVEQTLHKTDEVAFELKNQQKYSDLYVWPESGLPFALTETNLSELLFQSVKDWESALLTGGKGVKDTIFKDDPRTYVSAVLISHKNNKVSYHHKTVLTPGYEAIPYHSYLAKIPKFPIPEKSERYFKKGEKSEPIQLLTRNNKRFLVGVSLCYEQWYPKHWALLATNGAEFYTHLATEGWYGKYGFKRFMSNVTRMRAIENRKEVARVANAGTICFINPFGSFKNEANSQNCIPIHSKIIASNHITFYASHPNWFPLFGAGLLFLYLIFTLKKLNY